MSDGYRPQTVADIARQVGGVVRGDANLRVSGVATVNEAGPGDLTFIGDSGYARAWDHCSATAALVKRGVPVADRSGAAVIEVADAALAPPPPLPPEGVHPTAVVDPSATLGAGVRIGPHAHVGPRVALGAGCVLHASVTVLDASTLGDHCVLWPGVVVRERCTLGHRCILHPNVTIGADGFGYRPAPRGTPDAPGPRRALVKIPQVGTVRLGNDCEVGAGTCIDRAKLGATTLGDECKIDNLVQIAHNCALGRAVVIAAHTAIGGSVTIEDGVMVGGGAMFTDHIRIGAGARIAGGAAVIASVPPGAVLAGYPARPTRQYFREIAALRHRPALVRRRKPE